MSSVDATSHLNQTHKSQLLAYLKFFSSTREEHLKEVEAVFDEQKDMRLLEEMYQVDDVASILDDLKSLVKSQLNEELEKLSQQSVLYLRQLFLQAEGNGVALNVDLSTLDDAVLLAGIEKLNVEAKKGLNPLDLPETRRATALKPVEGAVDVKLVTQVKDLQDANRSLLSKFEALQSQCQSSQRECISLKEKNEQLENELRTVRNDFNNLQSGNASAQQEEIESLRRELAALKQSSAQQVESLRAELKASESTLAAKVNESPQYQQLKKLMTTKNDQLKEARQRIKTLESSLGQ